MGDTPEASEAAFVIEVALGEIPVVPAPVLEAPVMEAPVAEAIAPVIEAVVEIVPEVEAIVEAAAPVVEVVVEAPAAEALPVQDIIEPAVVIEAALLEVPVVPAPELEAPVVEAVIEAVAPVVEAVADIVPEIVEAIVEVAAPIVEAVVEAPAAVVEAVVEIPAPIVEAVEEVPAPIVETVVESVVEAPVPEPLPVLDTFAPVEILTLVEPAPCCCPPVVVPPPPKVRIPSFADLGELAHGVLFSPFNVGTLSLDFSTAAKSGASFGGNLTSGSKSKSITSVLESSHSILGSDFTMKYTSDRVLQKSLTFKDLVLPGLNLGLTSEFTPDSGKVSLGLKSSLSNELATVSVAVDDNLASIEASAVVGKSGWLAGILSNIDPKKPANLAGTVALGYHGADFQALTSLTADKEVKAQIYQKISPDAEAGIEIVTAPGAKPSLALAHKYTLSGTSSLAVKVDNSSLLSVAYSTALREGISLAISGQLNATNIAAGPNDIGIGLTVNA